MTLPVNNIVPFAPGQVPAAFRGATDGDDLGSGIQSSFGIISYRGKVWATKYQGAENALMRDDGDGPRNSIDVVILKAAPVISKIFYQSGFVDGSNAPPDCFSTNGMAPDPASPKKQANTCAGCPNNAWGSKVTEAGKQTKACADSKRLAVVPSTDINNEALGGPMLLRVPAASLKDIKGYGELMQSYGYPYYAVVTKIAFDPQEAFPKFVLTAQRVLTDEEAEKVAALRIDPRIDRILSTAVDMVAHEPAQPAVPTSPFAQPAQTNVVAPVQQVQPVAVQPVVQVQPVAAQPVVAVEQQQGGFGGTATPAKRTRRTKEQIAADLAAAAANKNSTTPATPSAPAQSSGFGASAPVSAAGPVVPPQAQVQVAPVQTTVESAPAPSSFDALLDELLPTT